MAIRLLHLSDLHLDCGFKTKEKALAKALRQAQHQTLQAAVDAALTEKCDIFALTGDVFHDHTMSFKTEELLYRSFDSLLTSGVTVVYQTGNHDYVGLQRSLKDFIGQSNFIYFNTQEPTVHRLTLKGHDVTLIGNGHHTKDLRKNWAKVFPKKVTPDITIGFYHGMVQGSVVQEEEEEPYMATTLSDLEDKGYDYWALGHIHKRQALTDHIAYAGSLQAMRSTETERKGAWLITLDERHIERTFLPLSHCEFRTATLTLSETEAGTVYSQLREVLQKAMAEETGQIIFNVTLMGSHPAYDTIMSGDFIDEFLEEFGNPHLIGLKLDTTRFYPETQSKLMDNAFIQTALNLLTEKPLSAEWLHKIKATDLLGTDAEELVESHEQELRQWLMHYFREA